MFVRDITASSVRSDIVRMSKRGTSRSIRARADRTSRTTAVGSPFVPSVAPATVASICTSGRSQFSHTQRGHQPRGDCQPSGGAADRDQEPLHQQLTDDIEPSRADGEACAQLSEARPRTRQRDVAEIAHSNHEHRQRRPPEQIERTSHVPHEDLLERLDAGAESRVDDDRLQLRRRALEVHGIEGFQLIAHVLNRRPGLQASEAEPAIGMTGFVRSLPVRQRQGNPEAGAGVAEREVTRQDPDDGELTSADTKRAPDGRGIAAVELPPQPVGEHDPRVMVRSAFFLGEDPSVRRIDPQEAEERRRGHHAAHPGRQTARFDRGAGKVVERLLFEDRDVPEPVVVVRCRAARASPGLDERVLIGHEEHAIRFRSSQRMEQHRVDARHDRRVPSQADGERDNRGDREAAVLSEHPEAKGELPQPAFGREGRAQP